LIAVSVAVWAQHQLPPEPLAIRMRPHQPLELLDQLSTLAKREFRVEALLESTQPELVQSISLETQRALIREFSEGTTAQLVDQPVHRHRTSCLDQQQREQRTLTRPPEPEALSVPNCLDRAEEPELDRRSRRTAHPLHQ
jgi:hypothetical protein